MNRFATLILSMLLGLVSLPADGQVTFDTSTPGRVAILVDGAPTAEYVYQDPVTTRPYFSNLKAPVVGAKGGVQVTRNHPPVEGFDRMDHPEYHPGLWMAFGVLSGADGWRLKAPVEQLRFIEQPNTTDAGGAFAVELAHHDADPATDEPICTERFRFEVTPTEAGVLLGWDSTFTSDREFYFGDQEEMGLGVRLATPLRVETGGDNMAPGGGEMLDSEGRVNAAGIWGKAANWIDCRGELDGVPAGVAIFCHPKNFRETRYHARDYGYVCANPFSLDAFNVGEPDKTRVEPGASLRLRYGVLLHAGAELSSETLNDAYEAYVETAGP
ncbi:DUF6807 family protein [Pseudobythopirellula maris]|nr:DUF6807 family protein [Pseudobythopirellula maris]